MKKIILIIALVIIATYMGYLIKYHNRAVEGFVEGFNSF